MSKYKVVLHFFSTLVMASSKSKCSKCWQVLPPLSKNPLKFNLGEYQLLHPPGLLHLPSNGQWGALRHRCRLETQLEVAVARDGLEYAL